MRRLTYIAVVALSATFALNAQAQKKAKDAKSGEVRKDPNGVKGISPFWELVKDGDNAYIARDYDKAISQYRSAIEKEPQNALGHYRMGEAQLAKGESREAEASWVAGLRFVGANHALKAKLLFVMADLRERQKAYDDATDAWIAVNTDAKFVCGARRSLVAAAEGGTDVWRYHFSYDGYTTSPATEPAAFHGLELVYIFGNFDSVSFGGLSYTPNADDLEMTATLQQA